MKITKTFEKLRLYIFKRIRKNRIFYINGVPALPEPLSKEEEEAYIDKIAEGYDEYREKLIVHNLRLVVYIAKKFENSQVNIEDLISIGN